jgi:hypothetical protein
MITTTATMITTQAGNLFRLMNPEQIGVALALGIDLAEFVPNGAYNSKP